VQRWLEEQPETFCERGKIKLPELKRRYTEVQVECVQKYILRFEKIVINKFY